ncbi:transcriptional regulator, DeoR family [Granulicatella balaenopterae]|uniref:Lactose phosphotransferase system repressor n=1 Tax=Granulicatella balaenopterae TaxID=137733 RepID=A0A1H9J0W4_9LACT|nr:DeoR/GlpR family DNA-binding transcription regulator [Granulicatella balaenopterae]SEQ80418.1 transcriptional regulator, DeoR family [Granulicatella balaenopterae]
MDKTERINTLIELIQTKKCLSVKELSQKTFFSTSTLRRDLIYLENQGLITRKHGQIVLNTLKTNEAAHNIRKSANRKEKKYIASIAKDFIGPGMCIYLDSSTTVYEIYPYLASIENLIIFTNGLNTAQSLADIANPTMKIFITGGEIKHFSSSVITQQFTNDLINHFKIDLAICSAHGIDQHFVYETSLSQAMTKKQIMDLAEETLLLIDSSKFNQVGFFKINSIDNYHAIISEKLPSSDFLDSANMHDVEWLC